MWIGIAALLSIVACGADTPAATSTPIAVLEPTEATDSGAALQAVEDPTPITATTSDESNSNQGSEATEAGSAEAAYPSAGVSAISEEGYPVTRGVPLIPTPYPGAELPEILQNAQAEPPNPDRELPAADAGSGSIAGILIQDLEEGRGYVPLQPKAVRLGEIIENEAGEAIFLAADERSLSGQVFPTGIFVLQNIPPGTYGLIVDLGYTQIAVNDESGNPRLFEIAGGDVIDLGQVITTMPK